MNSVSNLFLSLVSYYFTSKNSFWKSYFISQLQLVLLKQEIATSVLR